MCVPQTNSVINVQSEFDQYVLDGICPRKTYAVQKKKPNKIQTEVTQHDSSRPGFLLCTAQIEIPYPHLKLGFMHILPAVTANLKARISGNIELFLS